MSACQVNKCHANDAISWLLVKICKIILSWVTMNGIQITLRKITRLKIHLEASKFFHDSRPSPIIPRFGQDFRGSISCITNYQRRSEQFYTRV